MRAGDSPSAAAVDSLALQRSAYAGRAELVRARARLALGDRAGARQAADRALIAEQCRTATETRIVITHGTDTMVETAEVLARTFPRAGDKTIVVTGAMIPYAFGSSDGLFNLGSALSFVQVLPPGVYIAMNGRYFDWDAVRKNRETGVFEST